MTSRGAEAGRRERERAVVIVRARVRRSTGWDKEQRDIAQCHETIARQREDGRERAKKEKGISRCLRRLRMRVTAVSTRQQRRRTGLDDGVAKSCSGRGDLAGGADAILETGGRGKRKVEGKRKKSGEGGE